MAKSGSEARAIMGYSFLHALANDGTIDADELAFIEKLALRDGVVDAEEKKVLTAILSRVSESASTSEDWNGILAFKKQHGID